MGGERQAAACCQGTRPLSSRRGRNEAAVPGLEPAGKEWRMPAREWIAAKAQFAILFEDRFTTT
jgi:hypothetical protein